MFPNEPSTVLVAPGGSAPPGAEPSRAVVWVRGDHDITTRAHLSRIIACGLGAGDVDMVIDLSGVTFMDASTVGVIAAAGNRLRAGSRSLSVRAPAPQARRLLEVCGLAFLIEDRPAMAPARATALGSWVDVPARDRRPDATTPSDARPVPAQQPGREAAEARDEPAGSGRHRPAPP